LRFLLPVIAFFKSPFVWLLIFAFGSCVLFVLGMAIIFGAGMALISGSAFSMLFATVLFKGLGRG
jgi:hypothetical protein